MSDKSSVSTAVSAGAGTATSENHEQTCPEAGKEETMQNKDGNTSAAKVAEAQPQKAASAGAQADADADDLSPETKADRDAVTGARGKSGKGKKPAKAKKPVTEPKPDKTAVVLYFKDLMVSKWNRSYGVGLNPEYIKALASDIRKNKVIHPVTVAKNNGPDGPHFVILAGAHRVEALREIRGAESGLKSNEFKMHEKLDESNSKCMAYSVAENSHRYQTSAISNARYAVRMMNEDGIDQKTLAPLLGLRREVVNRLAKLVECYEKLPECWQKDLNWSASTAKKDDKPRITLSHWVEVAGRIGDGEVDAAVLAIMEKAYKKSFSAHVLRNALKALAKASDEDAEVKGMSEETKASLADSKLRKQLREAYEKAKDKDPARAEKLRLSLECMGEVVADKDAAAESAPVPVTETSAEQPAAAEATEAKPTA